MTTETVEEVDLDVDLDKVVPCQAVDNTPYFFGGRGEELGCEVPAEWVRTYPCCGGQRTYCAGHMEKILEYFKGASARGRCAFCEGVTTLGSWRRL